MLFKSELRILLLNSGDPQSSLARFLNSSIQGSPKFTRAPKPISAIVQDGRQEDQCKLYIDGLIEETLRFALDLRQNFTDCQIRFLD